MKITNPTGTKAGFGLIESIVTIGLFSGLLAVFSLSLSDSTSSQKVAQDRAGIEDRALRAQLSIRSALDRSAIGAGFPLAFDGTTVGASFPALAHAAAVAYPGIPANRDLVFRQPLDADGDDWPDLDIDGAVLWDPVISTFSVFPDASGANRLFRVNSDGTRRSIASNVGSLIMDDSTSSGFTIPLDQVRVRLYMLPPDGQPAPGTTLPYESHIRLSRTDEAIW